MVICDRCKKNPARPFLYGDAINEAYSNLDLCFYCVEELNKLIFRYGKGDKFEAIEVSDV